MYLDVSRNQIMGPLASLQKLLVLTDENKVDAANKRLLAAMRQAERKIHTIVDAAEARFEKNAKKRIMAMHNKLQSLQSTAMADFNNSVDLYNQKQKQEGKEPLSLTRR